MAAVSSEVELFGNCDICQWQAALLCYEKVVALKAAERLKKNAKSTSIKGEETLVELDAWYTSPSSSACFVTSEGTHIFTGTKKLSLT